MSEEQDRWTVRFIRADGRRSHTLRASRPGMLAGALGILLLIMGAGFVAGFGVHARNDAARASDRMLEIEQLRAQTRGMAALAARLESLEAEYERLRGAMTEGAPASSLRPSLPLAAADPSADTASPTTPAWPLAQRGFVTRTFGSRGDDGAAGHPGVDIAVPSGSYVRATRAGRVEEAGEDEIYGRYVRIAHGDDVSSLYGHNSWLFVQPGDSVRRLQVIALSGNTGRSTAPHLHFEVVTGGELVDPLVFVNQGGEGVAVGGGQNSVEPR